MPGPITQEYILRGTAQFDDIQQKVNQTQNFLNGLKLPTNLKASFTQTFSQLQGSIQKASNLMQQGFTTKGTLAAFNKEINNITLGFDKLNRDMSKISDAKLKETLKTTQEYQQALSKIKLEKSSATDIQGEGLKAYNQSLAEVYKNIKEISQFKGFDSFKTAFESGNFEGAKEALGSIQQHLSKFRSTDSIQKMTTYVGQLKSALEGAEKATAEETQRLKDLENAEQTLDAQGVQQLRDKIESLQRELNTLKTNTKGASDSINEVGKKSVQAATDIEQFKSRLTYFFGLNNGIQLVRRAFTKLIQTMKELDEVMTQTAVVTDYTVGDMWSQLPEITARANELGVAIKGVYEADMLFYQQGLKTNQVMELSNESMKMARIAGLDAKTATDRMTNALRGFNMELDKTNAQRINDVYNALAARTASNVQEISSAMTKVASLANSANMSFENTAAFLAQIVETTRESAETAGTALKTVIARFSEVKKLVSEGELSGQTDEGEEIDVNKVSTALRAANIDLNEYLTGAKGLDQIFMELSSKWDSLDIVTQRYIATMAAGSRQQSRFIALMQDYSRMQELTGIATNANGAAQQQFEKTLESFETVVNRLKNAWNSFLLGLANNEVIKGAINLFTGLINTLSKLIDTLSFGSNWVKTFLTAFLAIGGFSIGKQITNKMFAGLGAAMRGEGVKAGAAFNSGYKVTIKSFSAAHKLETQKAVVADNSLKTSRAQLLKVSTAVNKQGYSNISLRKLEAAASEEVSAQEKIYSKAEVDLINAQHAYAQSLGVTESQLEVYDAILKDTNSELVAAKVASTGLTYEQYQSIAATGAQNIATIKGVEAEELSIEQKHKGTLAELQRTKMKNMGVLASIKEAIATTLSTNKTKAETVAAWADVKAKIAQKMASMGLAGAILAAVAAITILTIALINSGESAAERYERLQKEFKLVSDGAKRLKGEVDDLSSSLDSIEEHQKNLNSLVEYTTEWKDETAALNKEVKELVEKFPELLKFATYDENGNFVIDPDKVREYQNKLENQSAKADVMEQVYNGIVAEAEAEKYYDETVESNAWSNGEGALTTGKAGLVNAGDNVRKDTTQVFAKWMAGGATTEDLIEAMSNDTTANGAVALGLKSGIDINQFKTDLEEARLTNPLDIWKVLGEYTKYSFDSDEESINAALAYGQKLLKAEKLTPNQQLVDSTVANLKATQEGYDETYNAAVSNFLTGKTAEKSVNLNDSEQYKEYSEMIREMFKSDEGEDRVKQVNIDGSVVFKDEYKDDADLKDIKGTDLLEAYGISTLVDDWSKESLNFIDALNKTGNEKIKKLFSGEKLNILDYKELFGLEGSTFEDIEADFKDGVSDEVKAIFERLGIVWDDYSEFFLTQLAKAKEDFYPTKLPTVEDSRNNATRKGVNEYYLSEQEQIDSLKLLKKQYKDLNDVEKQWVSKITSDNAKVKKSVEELGKSYDKWKALIKDDGTWEIFDEEDLAVWTEYKNNFRDMFNITEELDDSFYKDATNVQLLEAALRGYTDAYDALSKKVAKEQAMANVDFDNLTTEGQNAMLELQAAIDDIDFSNLKVGDELPESLRIAGNHAIEYAGKSVAEIQSLYSGLGFELNIDYTKGKWIDSSGKQIRQSLIDIMFGEGIDPFAMAAQMQALGWQFIPGNISGTYVRKTPSGNNINTNTNGSDKNNLNYSQLDEYINSLRRIEGQEQHINDIEAQRSHLLAQHTKNAKEYSDWLQKELNYLQLQKNEMENIKGLRYDQLMNYQNDLGNGLDWKVQGKNESGEDTLINVKDYKDWIHWLDDEKRVYVDWSTYNSVTDDVWKSNFDAVRSAIEEVANEYLEYEKKIFDNEDKQTQLLEEQRSAYIDTQKTLAEVLIWERQQEIDALTAINENINDAQSEIMDSIQKQIDLERQIRDNTKKEDEISDIENQIAFLSRDTSGANDVRIKELQKQLGDMTEEYQDTLVDQEIQRITDLNEQAAEQRERQIDILTKSLEYDQERGIFFAQAIELMEGLYDKDGQIDTTSEAWTSLMDKLSFDQLTKQEIQQQLEEFQNKAVEAYNFDAKFQSVNDYLDAIRKNTQPVATAATQEQQQTNAQIDAANTKKNTAINSLTAAWNQFGSTEAEQKAGSKLTSSWSKLTGEQRIYFGATDPNEKYDAKGHGATFDYFADGGYGQALKLNDTQYVKYIYDWAQAYDTWAGTNYKSNIGMFVKNFTDKYGTNGKVGWAFLNYMYDKLKSIFSGTDAILPQFATGGLARSTGLAWLDGTPNRPEYVLNPAQTEAFLQLPDLLRSLDLTAGQNVSYGDTSIEINIQVDQLASDYDVEQLAEKIKTEIYDDSAYRNVNSIGWIR